MPGPARSLLEQMPKLKAAWLPRGGTERVSIAKMLRSRQDGARLDLVIVEISRRSNEFCCFTLLSLLTAVAQSGLVICTSPHHRWPRHRFADYVYATSRSGTVHLIDFDSAAQWDNLAPLCGTGVGRPPLQQDDETLSGALSTCTRCRKIAGLARIDR